MATRPKCSTKTVWWLRASCWCFKIYTWKTHYNQQSSSETDQKKPRDMSFGCLNDPSPGFQTGLFPRCPHLLWQFLISTSLAASSLALPISLLICGVFAMALKHWPYPMLGLFTYRHNLRKSSSVNWAITWNSDVGKQCSVMLANLYPNRNHIFDGWTWCTKNDN